jgi:hypothetical protein
MKVNGEIVQLDPVQQTNGQLMGSPLSFPILCLANLGLYLEVLKDDPRPLKEKLSGVLVNGDDMIYVARSSLWEDHIRVGDSVGLVMSVGKSYCHPSYANANSACFDYKLDHGYPYSIPFLNSGLYFGQSKVLADDRLTPEETTTSFVINRLLEGALPGKHSDILRQYVNRHSVDLGRECRGRNLFTPVSLGGMGVNRPLGFATRFTWQQKAYARRVLDDNPHLWQGYGPLPGPLVPEVPIIRHPWDEPATSNRVRALKARPTWDLLSDSKMEIPAYCVNICVPGLEHRPVPRRARVIGHQERKDRDLRDKLIGAEEEELSPWSSLNQSFCYQFDNWQYGLRFSALTEGTWNPGDPSDSEEWFPLVDGGWHFGAPIVAPDWPL